MLLVAACVVRVVVVGKRTGTGDDVTVELLSSPAADSVKAETQIRYDRSTEPEWQPISYPSTSNKRITNARHP